VQLGSQGNIESGDDIADAEVDGVVGPLVAQSELDRAAVERPQSAVRVGLADVGAGVEVLVGPRGGEGGAAPFGELDVEVGGGERGQEGEDGEGLHGDSGGAVEMKGENMLILCGL